MVKIWACLRRVHIALPIYPIFSELGHVSRWANSCLALFPISHVRSSALHSLSHLYLLKVTRKWIISVDSENQARVADATLGVSLVQTHCLRDVAHV